MATKVRHLMKMKVAPGTSFKFRNNKNGSVRIKSMKTPPGAQVRFRRKK